MRKRVRSWWQKAQLRFWYKHTTVQPRWLSKREYCDPCGVLPMVLFEILVKFRDGEMYKSDVDWDCEYHIDVKNTIEELYTWWFNEGLPYLEDRHPVAQALYSEVRQSDPVGKSSKSDEEAMAKTDAYHEKLHKWMIFEEDMETELTHKLHQLIDIRHHLWT